MLKGRYIAKNTGRRWNTREEAMKDNSNYNNDVHYRYSIKAGKFRDRYPIVDYTIPYIKEKHVKLTNAGSATGAEFSTNLLDSIAVNAKRAGLDLQTALGIANKESTLNNPTNDEENLARISNVHKDNVRRQKQFAKDTNTKYKPVVTHFKGNNDTKGTTLVSFWHNPNPYWAAKSYAFKKAKSFDDNKQMLINGERYADNQAKKILATTKPMSALEAAFRFYKNNPSGYNPGQSNYSQLVNKKGAELMTSPEIQQWLKTTPYR